jgi:serine/threonine protein kinase
MQGAGAESQLIAGRYRLEELLDKGGAGAVYAAMDIARHRPVVVKLLGPELMAGAAALAELRRAVAAAARLDHPNVAQTYECGELAGGAAFIVMELVQGAQSLRDHLKASGPLHYAEAVSIGRQVAAGIDAAHRGGAAHLDLTPAKVLLDHDARGQLQARVVDFCTGRIKAARRAGGAANEWTADEARYRSPEQCAGQDGDERSDVYSIGVMLYEMVAGQAPFEGPTPESIALQHIRVEPARLGDRRADVPPPLVQIVTQALQKRPGARPRTAGEIVRTLRHLEYLTSWFPDTDFTAKPSSRSAKPAAESPLGAVARPLAFTTGMEAAGDQETARATAPTPPPLPDQQTGAAGQPPAGASFVEPDVVASEAPGSRVAPQERDEEDRGAGRVVPPVAGQPVPPTRSAGPGEAALDQTVAAGPRAPAPIGEPPAPVFILPEGEPVEPAGVQRWQASDTEELAPGRDINEPRAYSAEAALSAPHDEAAPALPAPSAQGFAPTVVVMRAQRRRASLLAGASMLVAVLVVGVLWFARTGRLSPALSEAPTATPQADAAGPGANASPAPVAGEAPPAGSSAPEASATPAAEDEAVDAEEKATARSTAQRARSKSVRQRTRKQSLARRAKNTARRRARRR